MSRLIGDKNGVYDLALVIAITKIPQQKQGSQISNGELPPTAKLHFKGGFSVQTVLGYQETCMAWIAVLEAEQHPADRTNQLPLVERAS